MSQSSDKKKKKSHKKRVEMPFLDHLEELRWRIIKSVASVVIIMVAAFPFSGRILNLLTLPNDRLSDPAKLIFLKPTGMILVRMELALVVGIIVSLPIIFYQFWSFVTPGLLPNEKRHVPTAVILTSLCFLIGSGFAFFIMFPMVLPFLYSMGTDTITATININEYISFVLRLVLVAGLLFELPILSFFLSRVGILNPDFLRKYRRYGIVTVFILAAIVTPPDPMSQLMMAVPLIFLYEISIWVSIIGHRKKLASDEEWEKEFSDTKKKPPANTKKNTKK
ncbi:twin-arginine translocase subunit TatC [candidate division KSB1 bacterium]|nr:twin-arginine translocase subunit TatC [candidate division KSB1 bacterium]